MQAKQARAQGDGARSAAALRLAPASAAPRNAAPAQGAALTPPLSLDPKGWAEGNERAPAVGLAPELGSSHTPTVPLLEQPVAQPLPHGAALEGDSGFYNLLTCLRNNSTTRKMQGLSFERLVAYILSSSEPWCERFARVQTYAQWAAEHPNWADTTRDLGIDLVATNKSGAGTDELSESVAAELATLCPEAPLGFTAIQCKFYHSTNVISKGQVDSFIAESNRPCFTGRCLVHTGRLGENAIYGLKHCVPAVQVIGLTELAAANINWESLLKSGKVELTRRTLRPYQADAVNAVVAGFKTNERGQLLMACGSGKTFTSLKIVEQVVPPQGMALFLVPSLALLEQTITDWKRQCVRPLSAFAVCSDNKVGQSKAERNEELNISLLAPSELAYPVTTDAAKLARALAAVSASDLGAGAAPSDAAASAATNAAPHAAANAATCGAAHVASADGLKVIFATYQSLDVIYQAQHAYGLPDFDLIVCDEAHRTASGYLRYERDLALASGKIFGLQPNGGGGAAPQVDEATAQAQALSMRTRTKGGKNRAVAQRTRALYGNESTFTRIHNNDYVHGDKRLYMTATPKIFGDNAKEQEAKGEVVLYSMDDPQVFGPVFYTLNFDQAVKLGCLVDFRVLILAADKSIFPNDAALEEFSKTNGAKVIGTWKALNKYGVSDELGSDGAPMRRAVAFAQVIDAGNNLDRAGSKQFAQNFGEVIGQYEDHIDAAHRLDPSGRVEAEYCYLQQHQMRCECQHIDGSMDALAKVAALDWLRAEPEPNVCKVLFNVRCLSEGVDVPALDGVVFLSPRKSQVDVVQIVGRVMRIAPGKKRGYVIIPVVTNDPINPETILAQSKDFEVVWQVLSALKSLNPDSVLVDGTTGKIDPRIEVVCVQREAIVARNRAVPYPVADPSSTYDSEPNGAPGAVPNEIMAGSSTLVAAEAEDLSATGAESDDVTGDATAGLSASAHGGASSLAPSATAIVPAASDLARADPETVARAQTVAPVRLPEPMARPELPWQDFDPIQYQKRLALEQAQRRRIELKQAIEVEAGIRTMIVKHLGRRKEWEEWGSVVADLCRKQTQVIAAVISDLAQPERKAQFEQFQQAFNASVRQELSSEALIELLAQHLVLQPVLDALFVGHAFAAHNPIARALSHMLNLLDPQGVISSGETMQSFYQGLSLRMANVTTTRERQQVILDLFNRFFSEAFPKLKDKLGIVYTPLEVVDFINHSVQEILVQEFGLSLSAPNVHILDPFAGTGTFIVRLLQSPELIAPEVLAHKYRHELHAFELMPLAYYIASINIEAAYQEQHARVSDYEPNQVVVLTDTFAQRPLREQPRAGAAPRGDNVTSLAEVVASLEINGSRRTQVSAQPLQVILGNPPYSVGQGSQNDDNQNQHYPWLEARIGETYVAQSRKGGLNKALYDTYVKSLRWASDHIGEQGVIAFISNGAWLESQACVGIRRSLVQEFSAIYVLDLKGKRRCSGEFGQQQGANIFGDGCRTRIAITILVKNPQAQGPARIMIGALPDGLNTEGKLNQLQAWGALSKVPLREVHPDQYGDWLNQRCSDFSAFVPMVSPVKLGRAQTKLKLKQLVAGDSHGKLALFVDSSGGLLTSRDAWSYNACAAELERNFTRCIDFLNAQIDAAQQAQKLGLPFERSNDCTKIKWDQSQLAALDHGRHYAPMSSEHIRPALYRPFFKNYVYYDSQWISRTYRMPQIFPERACDNRLIVVNDKGDDFSCLITDVLCDYAVLRSASQCYPRYLYVPVAECAAAAAPQATKPPRGLLEFIEGADAQPTWSQRYQRIDAISPQAVAYFAQAYGAAGANLSADDVFYYTYGMLNSADYVKRYRCNLQKERPRIPRVASFDDFQAFTQVGRELAALHLGYEQVEPYRGCRLHFAKGVTPENMDYRVDHLRYGHIKGKTGLAALDKTVVVYNRELTISQIPPEVHAYQVGLQSPLDWVVERYRIKVDKATHIINDCNQWAAAQGNPRYILELLFRAMTVGIKSAALIKALPPLRLHPLDCSK